MARDEHKNQEIEKEFRALENLFSTYNNSKIQESNRHPVGDPDRIESDLRETEKAHLQLLQSRLNATIAQELLKGMAESASENARFIKMVFWLNTVIAAATILYTGITWWSVASMREGNDIQRQILQSQKQTTSK